jgi:putative oxidoreductase
MNLAMLVLRVVVGALFVGHGSQKLFGWFGGHGVQGTGSFFESQGMRPGKPMAILAGLSEVCGGLLFALGLVTPVGAALLTAVMFMAIWTVHRVNGLWITDGGFEYNLVLAAIAFAVTAAGPANWSLDHAWSIDLSGYGWALAELGAGLLGCLVALAASLLAARGDRHHTGAAIASA